MNQNPSLHNNRGDSAGVPWEGREFQPSPFAGDQGLADPQLIQAIAAFQEQPSVTNMQILVNTLAHTRVLVPVVAVLGETSTAVAHGPGNVELSADKSADMAMVTLQGPDGRPVLPIFSCVEQMTAWRRDARPMPQDCRTAFVASVSEETHQAVLDATMPIPMLLPRPAVWAVAQGKQWVPFLLDADCQNRLRLEIMASPEIAAVDFADSADAEVEIVLWLQDGLTQDKLDNVTQAVQHVMSTSKVVEERLDSVKVRVLPVSARNG